MRKWSKLLSVLILASLAASSAFATGTTMFSDLPRSHWAYDAIQKAVDAGILQGFEGAFHGTRLLNRYQMAVIVSKLLDRIDANGHIRGMSGDTSKMVANLEALTIEFADELALINVKVSTLEDNVMELRQEIDAIKGGGAVPAVHTRTGQGPLGLSAYASFGLIAEDSGPAAGVLPAAVRYTGADQMYFTLPQMSLGLDKEVNPGIFFHAQTDYTSDVNGGAFGGVSVNEAFFFIDQFFGDIGGKLGAFALPFSEEHNGPFRSCNYTITPSIANTYIEGWRGYGVEFQRTRDVRPEDLVWKLGAVSGTDGHAMNTLAQFRLDDSPTAVQTAGEGDEGFGFYFYLARRAVKSRSLGWNLGYFTNGGDKGSGTAETSFWQLGLEYWKGDLGFLAKFLAGQDEAAGSTSATDFVTWYFMANFRYSQDSSISVRYEHLDWDTAASPEGTALTFAWNRKVSENSMAQIEYLAPTSDDYTNGTSDENDNLIQARYKVHF